jgi:vacuolar-type H+-ATPase subunit H
LLALVNKEKDLRRAADRSIRETRRDFDKRIDEIRAELQKGGADAVEKVEKSLSELKEDLQSGFDDIQGSLEDELETGRKEVREHPLLAVGVAVMAGLVVGMLLGKSKD